MNIIEKIGIVIVLIFSINTYSQQDPHYTQYMYNMISVNPAYVGSSNYSSLTFLARTQWVGLKGAPDTQTLNYDTKIDWKELGLGFNIVNDKIGPSREISLDGNISYGIRVSEKAKIALGMKLGLRHLNVDWNRVNYQDKGDENVFNTDNFLPTLGFGGYYYTGKFYLGVSVPNILATDHYNSSGESNISSERLHLFTTVGYVFDLSETVKFKPSVLMKGVVGSPLSADVSANFLFDDKFHTGVAWRWGDSVSAMIGFNINEKFFIGYAYDLTTSNYMSYNSGTHELFLKVNFPKPKNFASPRFF